MSIGGSKGSFEKVYLFIQIYFKAYIDWYSDTGQQKIFKWKLDYECDHAGKPRDRRNPDLSPSKRWKSGKSIKVGCMAKIEIYRHVGSDKVFVKHHWKHNRGCQSGAF